MPRAGENSKFLETLEAYADEHGHIGVSVQFLARQTDLSIQEFITKCWTLQKLSLLTFREKHYAGGTLLTNLRIRKIKKTQRADVLFDLALSTQHASLAEEKELARKTKLTTAATLLDEAGEFDLAIMALDAVEHPQKAIKTYRPTEERPPVYVAGEGRVIRQLTIEEIRAIEW